LALTRFFLPFFSGRSDACLSFFAAISCLPASASASGIASLDRQ
jgi:hypothetical protein